MVHAGVKLDKIDLKLIEALQRQGRITNRELAEQISLSPSACMERHKRLEKAGIIRSYGAEIALQMISAYSAVLVEVTLKNHLSEDFARFENAMISCPEVVDCYAVGGGIDYIVKFITRDIEHYQNLIDELLESNIGIDKYFTYFITRQVKKSPYPVSRFAQQSAE